MFDRQFLSKGVKYVTFIAHTEMTFPFVLEKRLERASCLLLMNNRYFQFWIKVRQIKHTYYWVNTNTEQ